MEIIIHQAILHVLDTTLDAPVLSGGGMELTAEKTAYLQNHIEKLLASDEIRQCRPLPDSAFRNELEHNQDFIDLSCRIAGVLFDYMHAHTTIPGADLAVVDFTRDGAPWLGARSAHVQAGGHRLQLTQATRHPRRGEHVEPETRPGLPGQLEHLRERHVR